MSFRSSLGAIGYYLGFFLFCLQRMRLIECGTEFMVRQLYSDNIGLGGRGLAFGGSSAQKGDDAFVTELSLVYRFDGKENKFDLFYRMQNLFYGGTDVDPRINNQLQIPTTEIIDDSVFINSTSTIGQYNNSTTGRYAVDNISRTGNTSEYRTFRINPYWRPHLGGYAEGYVGVTYNNIGNGEVDSNIFEQRVELQSGSRFDTVTWRGNFYNQDNQRTKVFRSPRNCDVKYQNYNGEVDID